MSRIYTRTGDTGETGLFGGGRVRKYELRVEAYGTVDELNAVLGVARESLANEPRLLALDQFVIRVQHQLFNLGAELATPEPSAHGTNLVTGADVKWLEDSIDLWEHDLAPLKTFILPGGWPAAARLHWARTVCRRAERLVVELAEKESIRDDVLRYVNRLSDALFVAARAANHLLAVTDVPWHQG